METKIRSQETSRTLTKEKHDVSTEVSRFSITVVGAFAVIVGLWSLACIVGGLMASGGPLKFIGSWLKAVTGV